MEQIILGIIAGFSVDVVEAGEKYLAWLRGTNGAAYVEAPIVLVATARAFLDDLEAYALGAT